MRPVFGATFQRITAKAFYPTNDTSSIGGGQLNNVEIKAHKNTPLSFPFAINYTGEFSSSNG
jgi:hypothetical protein